MALVPAVLGRSQIPDGRTYSLRELLTDGAAKHGPERDADARCFVALGAEKLAKLVLDEAGRNSAFKRIAAAALAAQQGPDAVAAMVDRRLAALERARGAIGWEKRKAFAVDLEVTLAT